MENQAPEVPQAPTPVTPGTPPEEQPVQTPQQPARPVQTAANGLAIAGMIVGIIAFLSGWIPVFGFIVAIAAVILSILGLRKGTQKGMAITGLVTGGLGLLWSLIVGTLFIIGIMAGIASYNNTMSKYDQTNDSHQSQSDNNDMSTGTSEVLGGYQITVNSVSRDITLEGEPDNTDRYFAVNLTIKNVSNTNTTLDPLLFDLSADGKHFSRVLSDIEVKPSLYNAPLAQGETITGNLVFNQPEEGAMLMLDYSYKDDGSGEEVAKVYSFHLE